MLLAEGWNSPRATICMHLAPTASRRIYQQRVGRVTRRNPGKEAGLVLDFVHPATTHDENVITLHSLLDRDVYRGGAIVVGPVRRGRGRRVRVEKRVVPVSGDSQRRLEVLERELWRIAVENLDHPEQHVWAALAGARVNPSGWRRAKAMLQHDSTKELRRRFLLTCVQRNRNSQLRLKALAEIAQLRDPEAFDDAIDTVGTWTRDDRRAGTRVLLEALAERRIGRRDQAQAWAWRLAGYTRDLHEEYAVQRWPETKRLLGLLVNSSGRAHGRNARRLVHAARNQDRRLAAALLAAAVAHTPEGEEVLRGARMRAARKPSGVARELLQELPQVGFTPPAPQAQGRRQGQRGEQRRQGGRPRRRRKGGRQERRRGERRREQAEAQAQGEEAQAGREAQGRGRAGRRLAHESVGTQGDRRGVLRRVSRRRPRHDPRPPDRGVVWSIYGHRRLEGKEAFDGEIENEAFEGRPELSLDRLIEEGDSIAAPHSGKARIRGGDVFRFSGVTVFTFEGDLISRVESYVVPDEPQTTG